MHAYRNFVCSWQRTLLAPGADERAVKRAAAPRVFRLGWPVSNVWLLPDAPIGPVLIDTGYPPLWPVVSRGLQIHGLAVRDLAAVILTHRHSDHAGNAYRLARHHGVPIYAHEHDARVLCGAAPRPRLAVGRSMVGWMSILENLYPAQRCEVHPLEDGAEIAGLEVRWMPGHTPGSIFLYHRPTRALFTGDGLLNAVPPLTVKTALALPCAPFCDDYRRALQSLHAFVASDLPVDVLYPGHGPPRRGTIVPALRLLLERESAATSSTHDPLRVA